MQNNTLRDLKRLIELLEVTSSDTLNIADAILQHNSEINFPELSELRQAFTLSLSSKTNRDLSYLVKINQAKLIKSLQETINILELQKYNHLKIESFVLSSNENISV